MTRRARSLGTFGLVLSIAAVWFLPWVVSGDLGQPFSEDLGGTVFLTVPLLIALDAIRRNERVVAVAFLLPMTALFVWAGAPGPEAAVANGAPQAETGIGALVALAGCALA
ncbi:MAG: hypothetical protein Q7T55_17470, partial [Solirubrobacteraceae bacterium]|nr:hypothetical protein [Solirubrobacteraceae bacterium]